MRRLLVTCTKRRQTEVGAPFGTCSRGLVGFCGATEQRSGPVAEWLLLLRLLLRRERADTKLI
jgi:hypothetical protein